MAPPPQRSEKPGKVLDGEVFLFCFVFLTRALKIQSKLAAMNELQPSVLQQTDN